MSYLPPYPRYLSGKVNLRCFEICGLRPRLSWGSCLSLDTIDNDRKVDSREQPFGCLDLHIWSAGPWNYWIQCRSQIDCWSNAVRWVHKKIPELHGNKTTLIMLLSCMFAQLKRIVEPSSCGRCSNETIVDIHGNSCEGVSVLPPTLEDSPRQWHRLGTLETLETCGLYQTD